MCFCPNPVDTLEIGGKDISDIDKTHCSDTNEALYSRTWSAADPMKSLKPI